MHILIVDNEVDYLNIMKSRLEKRGFTVSTVTNGVHALDAVRNDTFDVVILDVKMDGMDGIEILRQIKKEKPTLEVLLLSGHASMENAILGVEAGAADYLLKPIPINDLITRLNDLHVKHPQQ